MNPTVPLIKRPASDKLHPASVPKAIPAYKYVNESGSAKAHPTPIAKRTHTMDPVPFMIYDSAKKHNGTEKFDEKHAAKTGLYLPEGQVLMSLLVNGSSDN